MHTVLPYGQKSPFYKVMQNALLSSIVCGINFLFEVKYCEMWFIGIE